MRLLVEVNHGAEHETTLAQLIEGASIEEVEPGLYSIVRDCQSYQVRVAKVREEYQVEVNGHAATVSLRDPRALTRSSSKGAHGGRQSIAAPMPGKIVRVLVASGDMVEAGQGLVVVEAMKMQNEMKAPRAGSIVEVKAVAGETVTAGDILIVLE
jgi:biotin carboxyl carrier protein